MRNLGWANGWKKDPPEVTKCQELGHKVRWNEGKRMCVSVVYCKECQYEYRVDSSG